MARKRSATPEIRKKYQEKVSTPPLGGRVPCPVEMRITVLLSTNVTGTPYGAPTHSLLHTNGGRICRQVKDWCNNVISHGKEAKNSEHDDDSKHRTLIAHSFRPEVNEDDAYAIERVVENGSDQPQRNNAHNRSTEERNRLIIDCRTKP